MAERVAVLGLVVVMAVWQGGCGRFVAGSLLREAGRGDPTARVVGCLEVRVRPACEGGLVVALGNRCAHGIPVDLGRLDVVALTPEGAALPLRAARPYRGLLDGGASVRAIVELPPRARPRPPLCVDVDGVTDHPPGDPAPPICFVEAADMTSPACGEDRVVAGRLLLPKPLRFAPESDAPAAAQQIYTQLQEATRGCPTVQLSYRYGEPWVGARFSGRCAGFSYEELRGALEIVVERHGGTTYARYRFDRLVLDDAVLDGAGRGRVADGQVLVADGVSTWRDPHLMFEEYPRVGAEVANRVRGWLGLFNLRR